MEPMNRLTKRKSPRAEWLAYNDGRYFVTVCTHERQSFFGEITNDVMTMTKVGRYLDGLLSDATSHQSYIRVLQHVVMPNHFHAIVEVDSDDCRDAACNVPTRKGYQRSLLSTFIGSLKSAVTKYAHECGIPFAWQSRYHDHAIRGVDDNNNISQYIANNVLNWEKDCFY